MSRSLTALMMVLALVAADARAQSRDRLIDEIMSAVSAHEFPLMRNRVLPEHARVQAEEEMFVVAKELELGPQWKPGNAFHDRAAAALRAGLEQELDRRTGRDPAAAVRYKAALGQLDDGELRELLALFGSAAFRKAMLHADARMAAGFAFVRRQDPQVNHPAIPTSDEATQEMDRYEATPAEKEQIQKALGSSAIKQLAKGPFAGFLAILVQPLPLARLNAGDKTAQEVSQIIAEFRAAHRVPVIAAPFPQDFVTQPEKERAYRELANSALHGDEQALARIRKEAAAGDAIAQVELGRVYQIGGAVPKDENAAFTWTSRAAEQGLPRALFNLGVHYEHGAGVPQDLARAAQYYRRAAELGFARAQLALGLVYRHGKGVPQDFQQSLKLIESAAERGLPPAELALAEIHDAGAGTARDETLANRWLERAVSNRYRPAIEYRAQREERRAKFEALVKASPSSARAASVPVDRAEMNRRLLQAAQTGNAAFVRELLDAGADVSTRDNAAAAERTPLHWAAASGSIEAVRALVSKGAQINARSNVGSTPLHEAARLDRASVIEYLADAGADLNVSDYLGMPLHVAVRDGHVAVVSMLLGKRASVNARREKDGLTPMHMFAELPTYFPKRHPTIMDALIRGGADINARDKSGRTPLDGADPQSIVPLIERGARLSDATLTFAMLSRAVEADRGVALAVLEKRGFSLNARDADGRTLLHVAAALTDSKPLEDLLARGLDVNAADKTGLTPLAVAVERCKDFNVRLLMQKGARVKGVPEEMNPLRPLLVDTPRPSQLCDEIIPVLLEAGADARVRSPDGTTLLHRIYEHEAVLDALLRAGADPNARDSRGRTPLHAYVYLGRRPEMIDTLVRAGADSNAGDGTGRTPLHLIAEYGVHKERLALAQALVRNGARTDIRDKNGLTPLEVRRKGLFAYHPEIDPAFEQLMARR